MHNRALTTMWGNDIIVLSNKERKTGSGKEEKKWEKSNRQTLELTRKRQTHLENSAKRMA